MLCTRNHDVTLHIFEYTFCHIKKNPFKTTKTLLCSTAEGQVTGFANVLDIGGPMVMKTLAGEAVIGQSEHVTPRNGGK